MKHKPNVLIYVEKILIRLENINKWTERVQSLYFWCVLLVDWLNKIDVESM